MNAEITGLCSINACQRPATFEETGASQHWRFVVHYCAEHHREIELGVPVGAVGIDPSRVDVSALGTEEPIAGNGIMPSVGPG
jgi:hypothetical protein